METIHDLTGWDNANFREMQVKNSIGLVNSELRSATEFTNLISRRRRMQCYRVEGIRPLLFGKIERNTKKSDCYRVIGSDPLA